MDSFLAMVKQDFGKRGIDMACAIDPKAKIFYADTRALQQVLLNILTNASDALEGRAEPKIDITIAKAPGMVSIKLKDNGRGIDEKRIPQLFKPFHTSKKNGTGLGLVISKKMLARMNGTIQVSSRLNEGTIVELTLPSRKIDSL